MKLNAALVITDLSKCYDTIHPGLAALCAMKHGVPEEIMTLQLNILKQMAFILRTASGITKTSFGNIGSMAVNTSHRITCLFGVGQGMQDSGALWISLWAVLYSVLALVCPGAKFVSADGSITSERKGEAIIDDLDL